MKYENMPTKDNTLYLPIRGVYFEEIVSGVKGCECREVKGGITANKYLLRDSCGKYLPNPERTEAGTEYFIDDYNGGKFPFTPKPYKYLYRAVGYAKDRDTALVEVTDISFEPQMIRYDREGQPKYAFWVIVYHLGKVVELNRK